MAYAPGSYQHVRRDLRRQVPSAPAFATGLLRPCIQLEKMVR